MYKRRLFDICMYKGWGVYFKYKKSKRVFIGELVIKKDGRIILTETDVNSSINLVINTCCENSLAHHPYLRTIELQMKKEKRDKNDLITEPILENSEKGVLDNLI